MWRYLTNGNGQKPAKRLKTNEDIRSQQREYEKTRTRKFQSAWLDRFNWLEYVEVSNANSTSAAAAAGNDVTAVANDDESTISVDLATSAPVSTYRMFCKTCKRFEKSGTFVTGSTNFKLESIIYHDKSLSHIANTKVVTAKTAPLGSSQAEKCIEKLNQSVYLRLAKLFRNAHALAKYGRPFADFEWMCDLDVTKGLDVGSTYRNRKQCVAYVHAIAEDQRKKMFADFPRARFMSVISDGSTNSASTEAEVLYVRYCLHGEIKIHFVDIRNIVKADAEGITNIIFKMLDERLGESWKAKIVGIATDGAAVMLGSKNGVVARVKRELKRPFIQSVHCSNHRLELAYKDACRRIDLFTKIDSFLLSIYLFYKKSSLNRSKLKEAAKACGQSPLIPTRVGGTRWLPHILRAVDHILRGYIPIMTHITQVFLHIYCKRST